nr:zinc finger protein 135-like [Pongo pygmaeus]
MPQPTKTERPCPPYSPCSSTHALKRLLQAWQNTLPFQACRGQPCHCTFPPHRLGHHQARSSGASGERRQAGNCSLPSTERGQSPGTDAGQLETSPGILSWIKQEEGASGRSQQGPQETTGAHLCSETCPGRKEERSLEGGSEGQEPVWAAGGGPGKEGSGGSTCGGLLPDPREREVASLPPGPPSQAEPAARGTEQCPPCAQCGQSLGQKELSAPHQRAHHGPPPFAGAQCPKSFPQRATPHQPPSGARGRAHLHLRPVRQDLRPPVDAHTHYSAHIGEKPYECAECAKSFGRLSTLLEHWHTHTGEQSFQGAQCGCCFSRLSTLLEHRHTHISEKPFQCAQCDKHFTRLANLTVHQRVHSGERSF